MKPVRESKMQPGTKKNLVMVKVPEKYKEKPKFHQRHLGNQVRISFGDFSTYGRPTSISAQQRLMDARGCAKGRLR